MKLACPRCQEPLPYDAGLAGTYIVCPKCKQNALVPQLHLLPVEYQDEYRQEVETVRKEQESKLRKQEEALQRKQQRAEECKKSAEAERAHLAKAKARRGRPPTPGRGQLASNGVAGKSKARRGRPPT